MKMDVVGTEDDCDAMFVASCITVSTSLVLEMAFSVAPDSSTVYSWWNTR